MLKTRIWTALILLGVTLPIFLMADERGVIVLGLVLITLGAWEWASLNVSAQWPKVPILFALLTLDGGVFLISNQGLIEPPMWLWGILALNWGLLSLMVFKGGLSAWLKIPSWFRCLMGWIALMATWMSLCLAKRFGFEYLISTLALVWCADIGAYFVGRALGRHQLAPVLSPGKSWEGAIGGGMLVCLMALIWIGISDLWVGKDSALGESFFSKLWAQGGAVFFPSLFFLVGLSVVGDLFESLMKRAKGVKDSSHLLPGHGGILDRLDAVIACLPWCVFLTLYLK